MKRHHRARRPSDDQPGREPVAGDYRQLTSAEIAAIYNQRHADKLTDSDVRIILQSAHAKLVKALST